MGKIGPLKIDRETKYTPTQRRARHLKRSRKGQKRRKELQRKRARELAMAKKLK